MSVIFNVLTLDGWLGLAQDLSAGSYRPRWWKFGTGWWSFIVWLSVLILIWLGALGMLNFLTAVFVDAVNEMSRSEVHRKKQEEKEWSNDVTFFAHALFDAVRAADSSLNLARHEDGSLPKVALARVLARLCEGAPPGGGGGAPLRAESGDESDMDGANGEEEPSTPRTRSRFQGMVPEHASFEQIREMMVFLRIDVTSVISWLSHKLRKERDVSLEDFVESVLQLHEPSRKEDVEKTDHAIFELKMDVAHVKNELQRDVRTLQAQLAEVLALLHDKRAAEGGGLFGFSAPCSSDGAAMPEAGHDFGHEFGDVPVSVVKF